jgi:hypothetical protein
MIKAKYIMYEDDAFVIFPETMTHTNISSNRICAVVHSAGFIGIELGTNGSTRVTCSGDSISLKKTIDKDHDENVIALHLGI